MTACSMTASLALPERKPVSVNGVVIGHDTIAREAQNHPAARPVLAWSAAARALAVREILLQEANRLGLAATCLSDEAGRTETEEEALVRILIDSEVSSPAPDEPSCRRYYENNRHRFRSTEIMECAHILIAAPRHDAKKFAAARETAAAILERVRAQPGDFAAIAAEISDCPSRSVGGNLGQVVRHATTPEFEAALRALQPGELSAEPVVTRYGFHIVRLDKRIPGVQIPFEMVHEKIAAYLAERSRRTAIAQYIARLASGADVRGVDLPTSADLRTS